MSNHFKDLSNNPNKNSDGSDHRNSGQNSNSRGFDHKTWLKVVQGDDNNKIDLAVTTASTRIDTELWDHIDRETSPGEIPKLQSDSSTQKLTATEALRAFQAKQDVATQNTSTDYTSFFMNSMKNLFSTFTPKTSETPSQSTNENSPSSQNDNQARSQPKNDNQSLPNNTISSSSKQNYHNRTFSNNSINQQQRNLSREAVNKKNSPSGLSPYRYHIRDNSTSTQFSSRPRSEYSLGGRDRQEYGVQSFRSENHKSQRTMESAVVESTRSLWENLRHPTNTDITKEERIACEKHAPDLVKSILNIENPPGLSKLQDDLKKLTSDLVNGKRGAYIEGAGFPKKTPGIQSEKFNALTDEEKESIGIGALELPEKRLLLLDIKKSLDTLINLKGDDIPIRRKELEKQFECAKAAFDDLKSEYDKVNNKLQSQIKEALEKKDDYKDSKSKFDKNLTSVLNQMESVKKDIEKAGNGENSQLYIDSKVKLFYKLLTGGQLSAEQRSVTGLSTREQGLNVALDFITQDNSAEAKSELIEYYVREHINFLTAYKNTENKYAFTEEHKDKLLTAMIRNAQSLKTLLNPIKITDQINYSE